MVIIYDRSSGEVLDNTGTSSAWPDGPPDEVALRNVQQRGYSRQEVAILRLDNRSDLAGKVLRSRYHVDPTSGEVVIDGPKPQPPQEEREPSLREEIDALYDELGVDRERVRQSARAKANGRD